ncbi:MAG: hypothetical protein Q7T25_06175 [Sideroxyarcus sp.]|nr:hypothetical protein [Sideroxyarcus sp.]
MSNYRPPAIPPIQNIADAPTKNALLALIEGWQVRNGMTGSGENRFITKSEFDDALKKMGVSTVAPVVTQESSGSYASGSSSASSLLPLDNWWTGRNTWNLPFPVNTDSDNWHIKLATDNLARWSFVLGHPTLPIGTLGTPNILPIGTWNSPADTSDYMFVLNSARSTPNYAGHVALAFLPDHNPEGRGIVANGILRVEGRTRIEGAQDRTCTGINSPMPTSVFAPNSHMYFARDGLIKWNFSLGHTLDAATVNGANSGSAANSNNNMYLVDSTDENGGYLATFYPLTKGGGMRLFGRLSFDNDSVGSGGTFLEKMHFRDTQGIGWNDASTVTTHFNAFTGMWTLRASGYNRFQISANTAAPDCIRIEGSSSPNSTYLADHMTVNAVYTYAGGVPGVSWQSNLSAVNRVRLQAIISDLASTSVDHGNRINSNSSSISSMQSQLSGLGVTFTNDLNTRFTNIENRLTAGGL